MSFSLRISGTIETRGPVTEPFGTDWICTVYETLAAAARDEPWDESELDRVFEAYGASERGFRTGVRRFPSLPQPRPAIAAVRREAGPRDPGAGSPAQGDVGVSTGGRGHRRWR